MIDLRLELIDSTRQLIKMGLNKGASGNCSARNEDGFLITPTGLTVDQIYSDQIVQMDQLVQMNVLMQHYLNFLYK